MARCVQTLVLGRAGTLEPLFSSIEEFLGANTRPYYDVLAVVGTGRWQPQSDAQPWVRFCLRAHYYQVQTFLRRTRESERLMSLLEQAVLDKGLPERTRLALWDAAQGFRVRNSTYRTAADVEQQTASRDLTALVRAGLLLSEGEKKGRAYLASALLADLRRQAQESRLITDPYKEATVLTPPMASTTGGDTTTAFISGFPESPSATGSRPPSRRLPGER
jgi:DNA-binding transcriptional ArsR family regulator